MSIRFAHSIAIVALESRHPLVYFPLTSFHMASHALRLTNLSFLSRTILIYDFCNVLSVSRRHVFHVCNPNV
ncbi:uncharacterized protein LACBIDRAFT_309258 [Laccaria bicolor S238N-H82]|uniref:Predicted protein n=1 Tax=Laccaria bicolor (strain S238N-H82 / ATCC MYA-4686) TaxID=486041 RepID=B0CVY6_LACBS|nr:uncharacterized protein LACBIDRAFT_309258 [Laccaria bicolor S238N-H82]EDR13822.1 predicted protein [Laccaria bicolor S238N-H82]|eukprot:XP_001876320.1 predicted protein [Laccaria bicolor S238N-H82]